MAESCMRSVLAGILCTTMSMVCCFSASITALAQIPDGATSRDAKIAHSASIAINGEPFGVGSILVPLGRIEIVQPLRVLVEDNQSRIRYPTSTIEPLPVQDPKFDLPPRSIGRGGMIDRLRSVVKNGQDRLQPLVGLRIQFLFTGNDSLKIHLTGDIEQDIQIDPRSDSQATHRRQFQSWWEAYGKQAQQQLEAGDYPPLVQTYLTTMLASRFNLPIPDLRSKQEQKDQKEKSQVDPISTLSLIAGAESLRASILKESMSPQVAASKTRTSVPVAPAWIEMVPPAVPADLPIEPLAQQVPPEFFYLRFGSFKNYLWFQELGSHRGGDIAQLVMLRGFNYESNRRAERMLNTKTSAIAKLFGDSIIADMAIVGRDLYLQEGPSIGVIFEAKNTELLKASLNQDRVAAAKLHADQGARLETLTINGHEVSLLSTPDNAVRSFLAEHDQFVMISTSRHMVERFLQVGDGQPSLAMSPSFRFSRLLLPDLNKYSLFAYFSPEFFRGLLSPQYQIELRRRLQAIANIEMAEMGVLTASSEHALHSSIDELIAGGYLPEWFEDRIDGSRTLRDGSRWIDSTRGARGSFLPIADVELHDVSVEESARYREQAGYYQQHWQQTDPLVIGLRRFQSPDFPELERVALEAFIAPFGRDKYGWLSSFLAPPIQTQIQLPPDDIANVQVHMAGQNNGRSGIPNHVMFLGVKDMVPPQLKEMKGLFHTLRALQSTPAYLGAWPFPGYLDRLPLGLGGGQPDALGFSRLIIGVWRWQRGGFSVLSFDRSILENCALYLRPIPTRDPAQVRLQVGDLANSRVSSWINTFWYRRGLETSRGNALLLDTLQQQLHVPAPEALATAERLLDLKLQCPLGGSYQTQSIDRGASLVVSSAWPADTSPETALPPAAYQAPWLQWFRGGQVHLTQLPDKLILVGQFDMQHLPPNPDVPDPTPSVLPSMNFDLFSLPFKLLGSDKPAEEKKADNNRRAF